MTAGTTCLTWRAPTTTQMPATQRREPRAVVPAPSSRSSSAARAAARANQRAEGQRGAGRQLVWRRVTQQTMIACQA